jgi:hypothetical protein
MHTHMMHARRMMTQCLAMDEAFFPAAMNTEEAFSLQKRAPPRICWRRCHDISMWPCVAHVAPHAMARVMIGADSMATAVLLQAGALRIVAGISGIVVAHSNNWAFPRAHKLCNCTEMQKQVELCYQSDL